MTKDLAGKERDLGKKEVLSTVSALLNNTDRYLVDVNENGDIVIAVEGLTRA